MAGFVDIVPESEVVHGVTMRGIAYRPLVELLRKYPELWALINGAQSSDLDSGMLTAAILAGCDYAGDEEQRNALEKLPLHTQLEFIPPLIRLTVGKNGIGPLIQKLAAALGGAEGGPAPAPKRIRLRKFVRPPSGSSMSAGDPSEKSLQ